MLKYLSILALLAPAGAAAAADQLAFGPPAGWVRPLSLPESPATDATGAAQLLLEDNQIRFSSDGDQFYAQTAVKILKAEGLSAGGINLVWNPDIQSITVHQLEIVRDGRTIDVLKKQKFTVLRREKNLEAAMLDGTLTATLQPEDLRVGDVIRLAITTVRRDPVMKGHSEAFEFMTRPGVIRRYGLRASWPVGKDVRWRTFEGLPKPDEARTAAGTELTFAGNDIDAPKPPRGAPDRFMILAAAEFSDFKDWSEVSALVAPLYDKASALEPDSPLQTEIERIKRASPDPKVRAADALKLVQDQTRYVYLGMNFGGYVPAAADLTWRRRFGDCKGKTALLLALLRGLGIEAQAAVVASQGGDAIVRHAPALSVFDHVIVRARIDGRTYWLDGTRLGDRGLDTIQPPPFRWALPVQAVGAHLERIERPPYAQPTIEETVQIDAAAGLAAPAKARVDFVMRGDDGLTAHLSYAAMQKVDSDRRIRDYFSDSYKWVKPDKVGYDWDDTKGEFRLWMTGSGVMEWAENGSVRDFSLHESSLGWNANFTREPGPDRDAPYEVDYPDFRLWRVTVALPKNTPVRLLADEAVDRKIAGVRYRRNSRLKDDVVTMEASQQALEPEFLSADAEAAGAALRNLYRYDVALRVPATALPLRQTAKAEPEAPTDAAGFSRRAVSRLLAGDYDEAIADLSQAIKFEPKAAKHYYNRGVARFQKGDKTAALADFDQAIALDPANGLALLARAEIRLGRGEEKEALRDYAAAADIIHDSGTVIMRKGGAYRRLGRYDEAADIYDQMATSNPEKLHDEAFVAARCEAIAKARRDPKVGLTYCDEAIRAGKELKTVVAARGLTRLRLGDIQAAIEDYDRALSISPGSPEALYGRGIARLRAGRRTDGTLDVKAASDADPHIAARFSTLGLTP